MFMEIDEELINLAAVTKIKNIHLNNILEDPYRYDMLKGNLHNLYSYHFKENSVDYRIAYEIKDSRIIFYYMIAKRENFYKNIQLRT